MSPKLRDPESHQPVTSLDEFNRVTRRIAGLPEYAPDDPGRPFTEDDPLEHPAVAEAGNVDVAPPAQANVEPEKEDTTPSADNRDLYRQPTPEDLKEIRKRYNLGQVALARAELQRRQEKHKDVRI